MNRTASLVLIALFFGGGIGFVVAAGNEITLTGHDHTSHDAHAGHGGPASAGLPAAPMAMEATKTDISSAVKETTHSHAALDISDEAARPTIELVLHEDGPGSRNLELRLTQFRFAPEHVNGPHIPGEGHAHIYVNDTRIARLYGPWAQITGLAPGDEVRVSLNANSHEELAIGAMPIAATAIITTVNSGG